MNSQDVLSFLEKDSLHNNSSYLTVYELALILEEKYQVVSKFIEKYKDDILSFIAKEKTYAIMHPSQAHNSDLVIANHVKRLWLDYMENGEHGVISVRAIKEGTVGLIDTGEYYQSMMIQYNDDMT